ncbi:PAS domain S-box protein [Halorubrum ezzemoulense]|nr:PAS domain S-box protein [Halorubrum ezzemoulense]
MATATRNDHLQDRNTEPNNDFWRHAFEQFIETLPEAAFVVDDAGDITQWNTATADLLGLPADKAVGMNAYDVFGTEGEDETLAEEVVRTGRPIREDEFRSAERPDGRQAHARAIATPIQTPTGEVVGAVELLFDVTTVVEQRETLADLQEELSDNVETSMEQLSESTTEVADRSNEITQLVDEQAAELERTQGDVSGFSATVEEIASSAEEVSNQSAESRTLAEESVDTAGEVIDQVDDTAEKSVVSQSGLEFSSN